MNRNVSNTVVAVLVGAVAGGVTALLLAPASGAETRKKIKGALRRGKEKVLQEAEGVKNFAEAHKEAVKEAVVGGKEAYQKAIAKRGPSEVSV